MKPDAGDMTRPWRQDQCHSVSPVATEQGAAHDVRRDRGAEALHACGGGEGEAATACTEVIDESALLKSCHSRSHVLWRGGYLTQNTASVGCAAMLGNASRVHGEVIPRELAERQWSLHLRDKYAHMQSACNTHTWVKLPAAILELRRVLIARCTSDSVTLKAVTNCNHTQLRQNQFGKSSMWRHRTVHVPAM